MIKLLPIIGFIVGVYFFYLKNKNQVVDEVYKSVYNLAGAAAIAWGCSGLLNLFLKEYATEHGFYTQLIWVKTLVVGFLIGILIVVGLIEHKQKRDSKKA